jgi:hypothetical protein
MSNSPQSYFTIENNFYISEMVSFLGVICHQKVLIILITGYFSGPDVSWHYFGLSDQTGNEIGSDQLFASHRSGQYDLVS